MTNKIFRSVFFSTILVLIGSIILLTFILNNYFTNISLTELSTEATFVAQGVELDRLEYLESIKSSENYRITWIEADGTVLFDSKVDASKLENHLEREEIQDATQYGEGQSIRKSDTIGVQTLNYAIKLNDGSFIRVSNNRETVYITIFRLFTPFLFILLVAIIVSYYIAQKLAKRIVEPLNHLDLDDPLQNQGYDEIAPLLVKIDHQNKQITEQLQILQQKQKEFDDITSNIKEGLILLDEKENIISINPSAKSYLQIDDEAIGKHIFNACRNEKIINLISTTNESGFGDTYLELNNKNLRISAASIVANDKLEGISILVYDVTSEYAAEVMRREFTANVSHELKTPLQSIMGSAELLENNLVKEEDHSTFYHRIYSEAKRLLFLIDDIIRLSQLDEDNVEASEYINVKEIVQEVNEALADTAGKRNIALKYDLKDAYLNANTRLIYEIIYNLVDNAIRYNKENGSVTVSTLSAGDKTIVKVQDTGIGIPEDSQARIFERFYRVDKSHSRNTGGTGLGLSIVKHAIKKCHGEIKLDSVLNEGSTFTVTFPKA